MSGTPTVELVAQSGGLLQSGSAADVLLGIVVQLLGLAVASATVAGLVALLYRWYVRERVQSGLAVLFGLTVVALYLGTTTALGQVIGGQDEVLAASEVLPNLAAFAAGGLGSYVGLNAGDRLGSDLFVATGGRNVDADVSEIVQTVGRVTSVKLPDEIDDIVGYDPMPETTKEKLAGRRFLFPRRLTKAELRERLVSRLKADYGVGHVDLELGDDGSVAFLAVGSRAAGIGPTLPPATSAVAIRADPANAASAGDLVQVWETDPLQRVLTGELRGVAGEVVTVAIDTADTSKLDPTTEYKLVTLPVQDRPDREFASLLRAADETMGTVAVEAGSDLDGATVASISVTVGAITRDDESPETIPSRDRTLRAGDVLYVVATPDELRRLEAAAVGSDEPATTDAAVGQGHPMASEESRAADSPDAATGDVPDPTVTDSAQRDDRGADTEESGDRAGDVASDDEGDDDTDGHGDETRPSGEPDADVTAPESPAFPDADDRPGGGAESVTPADAGDSSADATGDAAGSVPDDSTGDSGDETEGDTDRDGSPEATERSDAAADDEANEPTNAEAEDPREGTPDHPNDGTPEEPSDDVLDSLPGERADDDVDLDDLLSTDEDVAVWDPDERIDADDPADDEPDRE